MLLYKPSAANCESCHAWQGTGAFAHDDFYDRSVAFIPSLVTSTLDRAAMIEVIACGRTGPDIIPMPQYLKAARTPEHPCAEDGQERPPVAPYALSLKQIQALATYV